MENYDFYCPIWSLPHRLKIDPQYIPQAVPYLKAPKSFRLPGRFSRLKIGFAWKGSNLNPIAKVRDIPVTHFETLFEVPYCTFYSLQIDSTAAELQALAKLNVVDLKGRIASFADTAAILSQLDLLITADSAPAHVAGALGIPAWVCVCTRADWRWGPSGQSTPWYPTLRVYRQAHPAKWTDTFERLKADLTKLVHCQPS